MSAKLTLLILDDSIDAWDRQPHESALAYGQFVTYRDLGRTRTLRRAAEQLDRNDHYLRTVAAANRWVERCEAWDRHRSRLDDAAWLETRRKAADDDARVLSAALGKVVGRLPTVKAEDLSVADLTRLLDVVMRHRRALFGDPTITVALTGPGGGPVAVAFTDFEAMSPEQRRAAISELAEVVKRRNEAAAGLDDDPD